uniref:C-type lectin domain-containing protein n=1 Tax=Syphacia muris TaxID=451379 RepID=A0A0N5AD08_9BILA
MNAIFTIVIFLVALVEGHCPPGWQRYTGTPDKCIAAFTEEMPWINAYMYCNSRGANLVSIHSAFQNFHIANQSLKDGTPAAVYYSLETRNRWTASKDIAENNCFICEFSSEKPSTSTTTTTAITFETSYYTGDQTSTASDISETESSTSSSISKTAEATTSSAASDTSETESSTSSSTITSRIPTPLPGGCPCSRLEIRRRCGERDGRGTCIPVKGGSYTCYCYDLNKYADSCP